MLKWGIFFYSITCCSSISLLAQSVWSPPGMDDNWDTAGNWSPSGVPDSSSTDVEFNGVPTTCDANGTFSVGEITFNDASTLTLSGTLLNVNTGISAIGGSSPTVSCDLFLPQTVTLSTDFSSSLQVSGNISGASGMGLNVGGLIELSGTSTYDGGTTVSGTLEIASQANIGGGAANLIFSGGILAPNGDLTLTCPVSVVGFENGGTIETSMGNTTTLSGTFTGDSGNTLILTGLGITSISTVSVSDFLYIAGEIGGPQTLTVEGGGVLTLSSANTYTGARFSMRVGFI